MHLFGKFSSKNMFFKEKWEVPFSNVYCSETIFPLLRSRHSHGKNRKNINNNSICTYKLVLVSLPGHDLSLVQCNHSTPHPGPVFARRAPFFLKQPVYLSSTCSRFVF